MNSVTKQYIHDVKTLFPSKGKKERDYLKRLAVTVDEYCEETNVSNKQDIYQKYGQPIDIVHDYYSALDTEEVIKRIRLAFVVKLGIIVVITAVVLSALTYMIIAYLGYQMDLRQEIVVGEERVVVDGHWDDDGNPIPFDYNPYADSEVDTEPTESMK